MLHYLQTLTHHVHHDHYAALFTSFVLPIALICGLMAIVADAINGEG